MQASGQRRFIGVGFTFVAVVLVGWTPTPVRAQWLLSSHAPNTLHDYNQGSGSASNPRPMGADPNIIVGIDTSPSGTLYALATDEQVYTVSPATGAMTLVGNTGLASVIEGGLGFDPTTGILYGLYNLPGGADEQLFTINTTTGAASVIGPIAGDDPSGLAFDNAGNLWVVDSNVNSTDIPTLHQINKATGATISSQSTGLSSGQATLGIDFNPTTNTLYMAVGSNFYSVSTATGLATFVDTHNVTNIDGLAYVPEPAAPALLAVAAVGALRRRKRKRGHY